MASLTAYKDETNNWDNCNYSLSLITGFFDSVFPEWPEGVDSLAFDIWLNFFEFKFNFVYVYFVFTYLFIKVFTMPKAFSIDLDWGPLNACVTWQPGRSLSSQHGQWGNSDLLFGCAMTCTLIQNCHSSSWVLWIYGKAELDSLYLTFTGCISLFCITCFPIHFSVFFVSVWFLLSNHRKTVGAWRQGG